MTLMVNARHLFYGLAMLGKYRDTGWKKGYLIFGMCDETFALNSAITPPEGVDRGWFYFFITLLNQMYWVSSGALGYLVGSALPINTTGVDFILTALITVLFLGQLEGREKQRSGWMGLGIALVCLLVLGSKNFILPALALIVLCVCLDGKREPKEREGLV